MSKKQKDNMLNAVLIKRGKKLMYQDRFDLQSYKNFVDNMVEGQYAEIFLDANKDDGTLAQLAKIHKCIREIALHTGDTYGDMKLHVKNRAGLCVKKEIDGDMYMVCKSFSRCSKEELSLAIEAIIEIGDFSGMNLR